LRRLFINLNKKSQDAFNIWQEYVNNVKNRKILDMYKTQKLWNSLNKIPNRTLRQAFSSITAGISPKVITALKDLYHNVVIR